MYPILVIFIQYNAWYASRLLAGLIVFRPLQKYLMYKPVKGCTIKTVARRLCSLSKQGSLSCHTCCDTEPRSFWSHLKSCMTSNDSLLV